jgi:hypothetical protein
MSALESLYRLAVGLKDGIHVGIVLNIDIAEFHESNIDAGGVIPAHGILKGLDLGEWFAVFSDPAVSQ